MRDAREIRRRRTGKLNAELSGSEIENFCRLDRRSRLLLGQARAAAPVVGARHPSCVARGADHCRHGIGSRCDLASGERQKWRNGPAGSLHRARTISPKPCSCGATESSPGLLVHLDDDVVDGLLDEVIRPVGAATLRGHDTGLAVEAMNGVVVQACPCPARCGVPRRPCHRPSGHRRCPRHGRRRRRFRRRRCHRREARRRPWPGQRSRSSAPLLSWPATATQAAGCRRSSTLFTYRGVVR